MSWHEALFYLLFSSQIFVISYFLPRTILRRLDKIRTDYPPNEYPKLYPMDASQFRILHWALKWSTRVIFFIGIALLLALVFVVDHSSFADDGYISEFWPAAYGMLQFVPLMAMEMFEFKNMKHMRLNQTSKIRSADLNRRGLFDVVSPWLVLAGVATLIVAITFDISLNGIALDWDNDVFVRSFVLVMTNLFLAGFGAWFLFGKKFDPHQSSSDRRLKIAANMSSFLYLSIIMSIYFMSAAADQRYDLDFLDASLLSMYFQAIVAFSVLYLMKAIRLEDLDFSVYKDKQSASH